MDTVAQKSEAWFELRRGKITGSIMDVVINGGVVGKNTLIEKLRYQIDNPEESLFQEQINTPSLMHGIKTEPEAIAQYEFKNDCDVEQPAFIVHPDIPYIGCSPDFTRPEIVGEVKCPYKIEIHEATVLYSAGVDTYKPQMQTELICTGADVCHFISYAPKYPDPHKRYIQIDVFRDEAYIENMLMKCEEFYDKVYNNERFESYIGSEIPNLF